MAITVDVQVNETSRRLLTTCGDLRFLRANVSENFVVCVLFSSFWSAINYKFHRYCRSKMSFFKMCSASNIALVIALKISVKINKITAKIWLMSFSFILITLLLLESKRTILACLKQGNYYLNYVYCLSGLCIAHLAKTRCWDLKQIVEVFEFFSMANLPFFAIQL